MTNAVGGSGAGGWQFCRTCGLLFLLAVCLSATADLQAQETDLQINLVDPESPVDPGDRRAAEPADAESARPRAASRGAATGKPQTQARRDGPALEDDRAWWEMLDYLSFIALSVGLLFFLGLAVWILRSPRLRSNPFNDLPTGVGPPDPGGIRWLSATLNTKEQRSRSKSRSNSRNSTSDGRSKQPDPPPQT